MKLTRKQLLTGLVGAAAIVATSSASAFWGNWGSSPWNMGGWGNNWGGGSPWGWGGGYPGGWGGGYPGGWGGGYPGGWGGGYPYYGGYGGGYPYYGGYGGGYPYSGGGYGSSAPGYTYPSTSSTKKSTKKDAK